MKEKRRIDYNKYIAALAITIIIFVVGILIGYSISSYKIKNISFIENQVSLQLMELELQGEIFKENPCKSSIMLDSLSQKLDDLGDKIAYMESELGKTNKRVLEIKRPYTLLQIRHYLLTKKRREICDENYSVILFFYSNKKQNIEECENQGYILDFLKEKNPGKIKVYAIDSDLDLEIIKTLEENYGIKEIPSLIINGEKYEGFYSLKEIKDILKLDF